MARLEKPTPLRITALLCLLLLSIFGGEKLAFAIRLNRSVEALEPDEYFLEYLKEHPNRLDQALEAFWDSGKLAHQQAALHLIKFPGTPEQRFSPVERFERYLLDGAASRDIGVRSPSLQLLAEHGHPRWQALVAAQLQDPDTHMRVLAMRLFRQEGVTNILPLVAGQLAIPDPYLVCNAVIWLQNATQIDHGMKTRWISGRVLMPDDERADNQKRYESALSSAKTWWNRNGADAQNHPVPIEQPAIVPAPLVQKPRLVDREGNPFEFAPFEGKPILYYFFTVWKSSPFSESAELNALHECAEGRVSVIGIALDALPDEHNETQHADLIPGWDGDKNVGWGGHGHHDHHDGHDHHHPPALKFVDVSRRVTERAALHGYRFPIAFDVSGRFTIELQAGEVPCFALVDEQHRLVRRFARGRSAWSVLEMLGANEEATGRITLPSESR